MKIVTTPMCEEVVKLAGIEDYLVNKNPDNEDGDLAILLSENKVKMNSLNIKLNTFSQIKDSIIEISKYSKKGQIKYEDISLGSEIANKYLSNDFNNNIPVKVYTKFLKDIVEDMGFKIVSEDYQYIICPDYLKDKIEIDAPLIEIPSHSNTSRNPIKRAEERYSILEKIV